MSQSADVQAQLDRVMAERNRLAEEYYTLLSQSDWFNERAALTKIAAALHCAEGRPVSRAYPELKALLRDHDAKRG